jgi:hypothetical protein
MASESKAARSDKAVISPGLGKRALHIGYVSS